MKTTTAGFIFTYFTLCSASAIAENAVGDKIVSSYNAGSDAEKKPFPGDSTKCYIVAYNRVNAAIKSQCGAGKALPSLTAFKAFDRVFGSKTDPKATWLNIAETYRGKGAAGALTLHGVAKLVTEEDIWDGKLEPGAVLQVWAKDATFEKVKKGTQLVANDGIGHSMIFLEYVKDGAVIKGMKVADQGTGFDQPNVLKRDRFEYWVGANLSCP